MASKKKRKSRVPPAQTSGRRRMPFVLVGLAVLAAAVGWTMYGRSGSRAQPVLPVTQQAPPSTFEPTVVNTAAAPGPAPDGMVWIPGGEFSMGANDPPDMHEVGMQASEDARPIHRVYVDGFFMDRTVVTNAQFAAFVKATGYETLAERVPSAKDFPTAPPENLIAGSVVFTAPDHPVPLTDHLQWWSYVKD